MKATRVTSEQYLRGQISQEQKMDTLEDIIRQFENQTQYEKDLTLIKARQDTYATHIKDSTQHNIWAEITVTTA